MVNFIFDTKWKEEMRKILILMVLEDFVMPLTNDEIQIYVKQLAEYIGVDDVL